LSKIVCRSDNYPSAWPFILGASVGDVVTIARRPFGTSTVPLIFITGRITQTERSFEFSAASTVASVTCMVDPCPEENALTLDDPVRGLLNGDNILGW
jgi:hypothetical protein